MYPTLGYLKLTQCYMSIISQLKKRNNKNIVSKVTSICNLNVAALIPNNSSTTKS